MSTAENDLADLPPFEFDKLSDGARIRLLEIQPAPNASETLNCRLIHVPVRKYRAKDAQAPQPGTVDQGNGSSSADGGGKIAINTANKQGAAASQANGTKSDNDAPAPVNDAGTDRPEFDLEMPGYEALSYRWGTGEPRCSIRIHKNGVICRFQVHKHLHQALLALRHKSDFRNLWVDNICVNQKDPVERSEQVARMDEIYGEASNVCIWLGEASKGSTEALEFLTGRGLNIYEFDELCSDADFVRRWASFLTLLKRDWFSRRWVVQEVSLAQSATVHCGSTSAKWEDFADAVSLLNDIESSAKKLSKAARRQEALDFPADLFGEIGALPATHLVNTANRMFKKSIGGHQRVSTLEQIVARLSMFESGEPRDYIYALLALAKDSQPYAGLPDHLDGRPLTSANKRALLAVIRLLPTIHRQTYNVDYTQDVVDVYQQFIAFALSKADPAHALDIICRPFAPSTVEALPSWIPVVSELPFAPQQNLKKGHFKMQRQRGDPFVSMPDAFPTYDAAGRKPFNKIKVRFRKRSDHYSMFVEGFILDTVEKVEPASQMGNIPEEWVALGKQQGDEEAFWKTLVADRGPKGGVPGIYGKAIKAALQVAGNGLDIAGHMREHTSTIVSDALPHVQNTIWGRCLIMTKRQHLGLGPKKLEKALHAGKKLRVCIIHGCTVPIILQECEKPDADIEQETKEDEADFIERQQKVKPYIERWLVKHARKRAEGGMKAKQTARGDTNRAGPPISNGLDRAQSQRFSEADTVAGASEIETSGGDSEFTSDASAMTATPSASFLEEDNIQNAWNTPSSSRYKSQDEPTVANSNTKTQINGGPRTRKPSKSSRPVPKEEPEEPPPRVYYKVIGESYIHNMMHGEAVKWQNDTITFGVENRVKTQIFELR